MGQKDPARRAKRRSKKPTLDDDLIELASVLAEYQLDNNAFGWFRPPWRDGRMAARLCLATTKELYSEKLLDPTTYDTALILVDNKYAYEQAGEIYRSILQSRINTRSANLIAAAMRCLQLMLSNSHGGGHVYNELLIPAFIDIEPKLVENIVLEHRCKDAIGTTHHLQGDRNDRQRSAFTIAWRRGLYLAAYSIQSAF